MVHRLLADELGQPDVMPIQPAVEAIVKILVLIPWKSSRNAFRRLSRPEFARQQDRFELQEMDQRAIRSQIQTLRELLDAVKLAAGVDERLQGILNEKLRAQASLIDPESRTDGNPQPHLLPVGRPNEVD